VIFLQTFSRFVVEADYFLNKSYIAKVLCINKERPQIHCNGKCYLAKQLKAEQKKDQQTPISKKSNIDLQWFDVPTTPQFTNITEDKITTHLPASAADLSSFHPAIFHPPIV
jgi:hypothetical protein